MRGKGAWHRLGVDEHVQGGSSCHLWPGCGGVERVSVADAGQTLGWHRSIAGGPQMKGSQRGVIVGCIFLHCRPRLDMRSGHTKGSCPNKQAGERERCTLSSRLDRDSATRSFASPPTHSQRLPVAPAHSRDRRREPLFSRPKQTMPSAQIWMDTSPEQPPARTTYTSPRLTPERRWRRHTHRPETLYLPGEMPRAIVAPL